MVGKEVGQKVRQLIDDHIEAHGIDPKIPPISLTDAKFADHIDGERSPRAKASEIEHALRYHIRKHFQEDEEHYKKLSERLEGILREFGAQWDALVNALGTLVEEARKVGRMGWQEAAAFSQVQQIIRATTFTGD